MPGGGGLRQHVAAANGDQCYLRQQDERHDAPEELQPGKAGAGWLWSRHVEQHDDEEHQHHDGAGVDRDLHDGEEIRAQQEIHDRQAEEVRHQEQGAIHRVALKHDHGGRRDGHGRRGDKDEQLNGGQLERQALDQLGHRLSAFCVGGNVYDGWVLLTRAARSR